MDHTTHAVILAAGRGVRLQSPELPKTLNELGGETILEQIISSLVEGGVERVMIVAGFKKELIHEFVRGHPVIAAVTRVLDNLAWASCDSVASLSLALQAMDSDHNLVVINGDTLVPGVRVCDLIASGQFSALVDRHCTLGEEETKVKIVTDDDGSRIVDISKKIDPALAHGESSGVIFIPKSLIARTREIAMQLESDPEGRMNQAPSAWALLLKEERFVPVELNGDFWIEIDTQLDLARARRFWQQNRMEA